MFDYLDFLGKTKDVLDVFIAVVLFHKYKSIFVALIMLPIFMSLVFSAVEAREEACFADEDARYAAASESERKNFQFTADCGT